MPCYHPRKAWVPLSNIDGGRYVFDATKALNPDRPSMLPCGGCVGCRQERVSSWAIRCRHEAGISKESCFLTLTFADEHLPQNGSVSVRDLQLFMKRLRKRFGRGIRFYGCGEYGDKTFRPHYHVLLFGFDFPDKVFFTRRNGYPVYKSAALDELWPSGHHEIGSVTAESAGYCSQYCQKKVTGKPADDHYFRVSPVDGQAYRVHSEFATMSRRPGIGDEWFNRFASDAFPSDFLIVDGQRRPVPSFYLKRLAREDAVDPVAAPEGRYFRYLASPMSAKVKRRRVRSAAKPEARWNRTADRLAVREYIKLDRLKRLVRSL